MNIQKKKARDSGIKFTADFRNISEREDHVNGEEEKESPLVRCDEQRIMQILLNIQSNALKFTEKGGVTISVDILAKENGTKLLQV